MGICADRDPVSPETCPIARMARLQSAPCAVQSWTSQIVAYDIVIADTKCACGGKIQMQHIDAEQLAEEKRRIKGREKPRAALRSRAGLANIRVVQPNLVYAVGLPMDTCHEDVLREQEFFGQFGRIVKVSVNRAQPHGAGPAPPRQGATGSAYVTFRHAADALRCIKALDGGSLRGKPIKACFGTTKYCNAFLKGLGCNNPDCLYLHAVADDADCLTKEEVAAGQLPSRFMALGAHNTFCPRLTIHPVGSSGERSIAVLPVPRAAGRAAEGAAPQCAGARESVAGATAAATRDPVGGSAPLPGRCEPASAVAEPPPPPAGRRSAAVAAAPHAQKHQEWPELGGVDRGKGGAEVPGTTMSPAGCSNGQPDAPLPGALPAPPSAGTSQWAATVAAPAEAKAAKRAAAVKKPQLVPLPSPAKVKPALISPRLATAVVPLSGRACAPRQPTAAQSGEGEAQPAELAAARSSEAAPAAEAPAGLGVPGSSAPARRLVAPPGFESWDAVRAPSRSVSSSTLSEGLAAPFPRLGAEGAAFELQGPTSLLANGFRNEDRPPLALSTTGLGSGRRQQSRFAFAQGEVGGPPMVAEEPARAVRAPPGFSPPAPPHVAPGLALLQQLRAGVPAGLARPQQPLQQGMGHLPFPDPAVMAAQPQLSRPAPPGFDLRT
ncbi:hypothetical protein ACKKBG_A38790 [Auxenochlorella protothecoides x Auxenochlorella symbiontica]